MNTDCVSSALSFDSMYGSTSNSSTVSAPERGQMVRWARLTAAALPVVLPLLARGVSSSMVDASALMADLSLVLAKGVGRGFDGVLNRALPSIGLPVAEGLSAQRPVFRAPKEQGSQPVAGWPSPVILSHREYAIEPVDSEALCQLTPDSNTRLHNTLERWMADYENHQCPLIIAESHTNPVSIVVRSQFVALAKEYSKEGLTFLMEGSEWNDGRPVHAPDHGIEDAALHQISKAFACFGLDGIEQNMSPEGANVVGLCASSLFDSVKALLETPQKPWWQTMLMGRKDHSSLEDLAGIEPHEKSAFGSIVSIFYGMVRRNEPFLFGSPGHIQLIKTVVKEPYALPVLEKLGVACLKEMAKNGEQHCNNQNEECLLSDTTELMTIIEQLQKFDGDLRGFWDLVDPWVVDKRNDAWVHNTIAYQAKAPDRPVVINCGSAHVYGFTKAFLEAKNSKESPLL